MRLIFWNCNMALHRKFDAVAALNPDIAVISECADPPTLLRRGLDISLAGAAVWVGDNPNKGLGVFGFNGHRVNLHQPHFPRLKYIAPVHISGPNQCNILAVWAQNVSGGITRKHQLGPLRRSLTKYREFLSAAPTIIGGDFNNNAIWDKPGWRNNHMTKVALLEKMGFVSAYHHLRGEKHGLETTPTLYWRDRRKDGPTYHIDYIFLRNPALDLVREFSVGTFEDWCGNGLSDHVPIVLDIDLGS